MLSWRRSPLHSINCLLDVTREHLEALNITLLVLDFDGVMASHGEKTPRPEVLSWLTKLMQSWPGLKLAILSNKPLAERQAFFSAYYPEIIFKLAADKKPYPTGLQELAKQCDIPVSRVLLIDDRWLTGMLASLLAGAQGLYIQKPYVNFRARPVTESFFALLRALERLFLSC